MSHVGRIALGDDVFVDVLRDALADHPRALTDAFPGAPSVGWDSVRSAFPETVGLDDRWRFPTHVFLVRSPAGVVLIDAGIGPAGTAAAGWLGLSGTLDADLAALGVAPDEIGTVVLTHLHQDHVGWLAAPGALRATFPRARHIVAAGEWASAHGAATAPHVRAAFDPVVAAGLLDVGGALPNGLEPAPLPGHTPGHTGVLVTGGERRLLVAGDTCNHALQLADPDVPSIADGDRDRAVATRRALLARARAEDLLVLGAHLPGARWPLEPLSASTSQG